jgi:hypothetical protein
MLQRLKSLINNTRIFFDYFSYEKECRNNHEVHASNKFPISDLTERVSKLRNDVSNLASDNFDRQITSISSKLAKSRSEGTNSARLLSLFKRHYKEELDELYRGKDALYQEKKDLYKKIGTVDDLLSEAYREKDFAYENANDAQNRVDSWHSSSKRTPWLFGNGGKKIPEHHLFFRSHGDLSGHKNERSAAYERANSARDRISNFRSRKQNIYDEISMVKIQINNFKKSINKVKSDRQEMYDLKKQGHSYKSIKGHLSECQNIAAKEAKSLDDLKQEKSNFEQRELTEVGVFDLECKLTTMVEERKIFISSFDEKENILKRKEEHRREWLCKPSTGRKQ